MWIDDDDDDKDVNQPRLSSFVTIHITTDSDASVGTMDMIAIVMPPPPAVSSPQSSSPVAAASEPLASTSTINSIDDAKGLAIALEQAERGRAEGGIPIGSALLTRTGDCLGLGHNLRVQRGSPTLHAEIAALEDAGRLPAAVYRDCTLVSFCSSSLRFLFFFSFG
jgi:hypothetical protein